MKLKLYLNTIKYLKCSQIYHRLRKKTKLIFRIDNKLIKIPIKNIAINYESFYISEIDFDDEYQRKFDFSSICDNEFIFINQKVRIDLDTSWNDKLIPHLWRYNLHYFEYLFSLAYKFKNTKEDKYYIKYCELISKWITNNIPFAGDGWHPYTISLRLVNWISTITVFKSLFENDQNFKLKFISSVELQYRYLKNNLEKDVLGNHYFENIKALILCSIWLNEADILRYSVNELQKQVNEQVLPDGMHFELSPMYHKIILEDLIRINYWLKNIKHGIYYDEIISKMLNYIYSIEKDINVTPLFNDSASGISKELRVLLLAANTHFNITAEYIESYENGGIHLQEVDNKKLIFDVGKICPDYLPAHGHCDTLSYELYCDSEPFIVNSGTYEYNRGEWRNYFRSTQAHNTVLINKEEQAQFWSSFRIANRVNNCLFESVIVNDKNIFKGYYRTYTNKEHRRVIGFINKELLLVIDNVSSRTDDLVSSYIHLSPKLIINEDNTQIIKDSVKRATIIPINIMKLQVLNGWYSKEFGIKEKNSVIEMTASSKESLFGYIVNFSNLEVTVTLNSKLLLMQVGEEIYELEIKLLVE